MEYSAAYSIPWTASLEGSPMAASDLLKGAAQAHAEALAAQVAQQVAAGKRDEAVREAHSAGVSVPEIAAALGVVRYRIYAILNK